MKYLQATLHHGKNRKGVRSPITEQAGKIHNKKIRTLMFAYLLLASISCSLSYILLTKIERMYSLNGTVDIGIVLYTGFAVGVCMSMVVVFSFVCIRNIPSNLKRGLFHS